MLRRLSVLMLLGTPAVPAATQAPAAAAVSGPLAPYDWLVGDWYAQVGTGGLRELITYGPNRGYIKFSVFTGAIERPDHLHFEGIALWNARSKKLDYLFSVEPGSGVQEKGVFRLKADGSIIREVELTDAKGKVGTFRQTFRRTGPDRVTTSVLRKTETGWVPTFAGSERIELKRRPA